MTYAAVPVLRMAPALAPAWLGPLTAPHYDPRPLPIAEKSAALCGMGMTEKQGGSDVRSNQTRAVAASQRGAGREYLVTGHKWFCSAPTSDALLVLAQTAGGLSCFLVPRVLADGTRNPYAIVRLKNKLGNRSNASGEIEFDATHGWLIGEEGEGLARIVAMVNSTRLDCAIGSAALMRAAVVQAIHHATYRRTFGKRLVEHPLMQNVLADLALESEAATALFMRVARVRRRGRVERATRPRCGASARRWQVLRLQTDAGGCRRGARVRWAETATSRSRSCRGSTVRLRSTRSGKDRVISMHWTCCEFSASNPKRSPPGARRSNPCATSARFARVVGEVERDLLSLEEFPEARARSLSERMARALAGGAPRSARPGVCCRCVRQRAGLAIALALRLERCRAGRRCATIVERAAPAGVEAVPA